MTKKILLLFLFLITMGYGNLTMAQQPLVQENQQELSNTENNPSGQTIPPASPETTEEPKTQAEDKPKTNEKKIAGIFLLVFVAVIVLRVVKLKPSTDGTGIASKDHWLWLSIGFLCLLVAHVIGIFVAPEEAMMKEVGRILYVHVPTAWVSLSTFLIAFVLAIGSLWTGKKSWDAGLIASCEVGVLLSVMLTVQGSIWAKPTWGTWWTWDPRLTTTAIMVLSFSALLLLRSLIRTVDRGSVLMAVGTIIAFINVPIVYFSVKWWNTLHQDFSTANTISTPMVLPLRLAAFGMLFIMFGLLVGRARLALRQLTDWDTAPELPSLQNIKPLEVD